MGSKLIRSPCQLSSTQLIGRTTVTNNHLRHALVSQCTSCGVSTLRAVASLARSLIQLHFQHRHLGPKDQRKSDGNYRDKLFHGVKARDGLLLQGAAARWDR